MSPPVTLAARSAAKGARVGPAADRPGRVWGPRAVDVLVVVVMVVGTLLALPRPNVVPQPRVDLAAAAGQARSQLGFDPSVPVELPAGWVPRAAGVRRGSTGITGWYMAFRTPSNAVIGVDQAGTATRGWENSLASGGAEAGLVLISGRVWERRYRSDREVTSLILARPGLVTMIEGRASLAEVEALAASLRGL